MAVLTADQAKADLGLFASFCEQLLLENGQPMVIEPFQRQALTDYFEGTTETLILVSKKNGKSSLLGALALFHLLVTPDAECVIGASSRDQGRILFRQAAGLVTRSKLGYAKEDPSTHSAPLVVKQGYNEIQSRRDAGRIRVMAADANTGDGVIPTLALVDELHRHRSGDLYGVFRDGLGPRDGQIVTISTAGADIESPLGLIRQRAYELEMRREGRAYRYARSPNGQFVMHEWALDPDADTDDMEVVKEANPASWQTIEALQRRFVSPSTMNWQWLRFACGIWTRGEDQWIPRYRWDECSWEYAETTAADDDGAVRRSTSVVLAFDGSYNGDSTALVASTIPKGIEGREREDEDNDDLPRYIGPPPHLAVVDVWERPASAPDDWTVPILEVEKAIITACRRWRVKEIAADASRWQRSLEVLRARGLPVVEFPQHPARMVPATTRLHTAVMRSEGGITHSGDERLARHVENAVLKISERGGQISKPTKTSALKIDLAVCAIMAFERAHFYIRGRPATVINLDEIETPSFDPRNLPPP